MTEFKWKNYRLQNYWKHKHNWYIWDLILNSEGCLDIQKNFPSRLLKTTEFSLKNKNVFFSFRTHLLSRNTIFQGKWRKKLTLQQSSILITIILPISLLVSFKKYSMRHIHVKIHIKFVYECGIQIDQLTVTILTNSRIVFNRVKYGWIRIRIDVREKDSIVKGVIEYRYYLWIYKIIPTMGTRSRSKVLIGYPFLLDRLVFVLVQIVFRYEVASNEYSIPMLFNKIPNESDILIHLASHTPPILPSSFLSNRSWP